MRMLSILTELSYNIVKFMHKIKKTEHAGYMLGPAIDGSHRGDRLSESIIHRAANSRVDYFCLKDKILTIKLAKAIVNINVSNTVIKQHPPSDWECADSPLETLIYCINSLSHY
jgi:hypothetical protein